MWGIRVRWRAEGQEHTALGQQWQEPAKTLLPPLCLPPFHQRERPQRPVSSWDRPGRPAGAGAENEPLRTSCSRPGPAFTPEPQEPLLWSDARLPWDLYRIRLDCNWLTLPQSSSTHKRGTLCLGKADSAGSGAVSHLTRKGGAILYKRAWE